MKTANNIGSLILSLCLFLPATLAHAEAESNALALVEKLNSDWNQRFNNADAAALTSLYARDAIVSPGNGETLHGQSAIQELFTGFFENGLHNHMIDTISSFRQGDSITQIARWQANGQIVDGQKPVYGGILVSVFKMDDNGDWKVYLHLWNMSS